eukprot:m.360536 g.360536  ORF g.360536 m.360536 type:complete len:401 (-) comp19084_c0_seq1:204-1406(-)
MGLGGFASLLRGQTVWLVLSTTLVMVLLLAGESDFKKHHESMTHIARAVHDIGVDMDMEEDSFYGGHPEQQLPGMEAQSNPRPMHKAMMGAARGMSNSMPSLGSRQETIQIDDQEPNADTNPGTVGDEQPARMLVRTGELRIVTLPEQGQVTWDRVQDLVKEHRGYIQSTESRKKQADSSRQAVYIRASIKVPADRFDAFLDDVENRVNTLHSNVTQRSFQSKDVTSEYVDSASRLRALEVVRDRLEMVMNKADTVKDVLLVQQELTRVTQQIEAKKGVLKHLRAHSSMSTLTLSIEEKQVSPAPTPIPKPNPVIKYLDRHFGFLVDLWVDIFNSTLVVAATLFLVVTPLAVCLRVVVPPIFNRLRPLSASCRTLAPSSLPSAQTSGTGSTQAGEHTSQA